MYRCCVSLTRHDHIGRVERATEGTIQIVVGSLQLYIQSARPQGSKGWYAQVLVRRRADLV